MTDELTKRCSICGNKVSVDKIVFIKGRFVCDCCFKQKKHKKHFEKKKPVKNLLIGIVFCILGGGLFVFAIWLWFVLVQEEGIFATAMAGGVIALAVVLFKLGASSFR